MIDRDFADDDALCRERCDQHGNVRCHACREQAQAADPVPVSVEVLCVLLDPDEAWSRRDEDDAWQQAEEAGLVFAYWHQDDADADLGPTAVGLTHQGTAALERAFDDVRIGRAYDSGWSPERRPERTSATDPAYDPHGRGHAAAVAYLRESAYLTLIVEVIVEVREGRVHVGQGTAVQVRSGARGEWVVLPRGIGVDLLPEEREDAIAYGESRIGGGR